MNESGLSLSEREKWVLSFLYAKCNHKLAAPIMGFTRINAGMYLATKHLQEKHGIDTTLRFIRSEYGYPTIKDENELLKSMEIKNLISIYKNNNETKYKITRKGISLNHKYWLSLSRDVRYAVTWLKNKHINRETPGLLSFIYRSYGGNNFKNDDIVEINE